MPHVCGMYVCNGSRFAYAHIEKWGIGDDWGLSQIGNAILYYAANGSRHIDIEQHGLVIFLSEKKWPSLIIFAAAIAAKKQKEGAGKMLDFLLYLFFGNSGDNSDSTEDGHYCSGCDTHYIGTKSFVHDHKEDCSAEVAEEKRRRREWKAHADPSKNRASPPPCPW